jgi:hypothetical protein
VSQTPRSQIPTTKARLARKRLVVKINSDPIIIPSTPATINLETPASPELIAAWNGTQNEETASSWIDQAILAVSEESFKGEEEKSQRTRDREARDAQRALERIPLSQMSDHGYYLRAYDKTLTWYQPYTIVKVTPGRFSNFVIDESIPRHLRTEPFEKALDSEETTEAMVSPGLLKWLAQNQES